MSNTPEIKLIEQAEEEKELTKRVLNDLEALEFMMEHDLIEKDGKRIGVEQELNFVDHNLRPSLIGLKVLSRLPPKNYTAEFSLFNLEFNLDPITIDKNMLEELRSEFYQKMKTVEKEAAVFNSHVVVTGILPTIQKEDLTIQALTPIPRYQALLNGVKQQQGDRFQFHIEGLDELIMQDHPAAFGGTMTSLQIHYQCNLENIIAKFNWAQAIAAPVLAVATNSPLFLGKRLWRETRVALFRQTSDVRKPYDNDRNEDARVSFGNDWAYKSILEVFYNDISGYKPFLTTQCDEDSLEKVKNGEVPELQALNFFNGTIYRWNRICYGVLNGKPGLRIENRILPAGPSIEDQVANTALWIGLMEGMPDEYRDLSEKMDFSEAKSNFYKAAQTGMDCQFTWLHERMIPAQDLLLQELLPIAEKGLQKIGIDQEAISRYLGIIRERIEYGMTGSQWLLESFNSISRKASPNEALKSVTQAMINRQFGNTPVHQWELAKLGDNAQRISGLTRIDQLMENNYHAVKDHDLIELAAQVMKWKNLESLLVEDDEGTLKGLVTKNDVLEHLARQLKQEDKRVTDIMIADLVTVPPETPPKEALNIMIEKDINTLPVTRDGNLLGVITRRNFLVLAGDLLDHMNDEKMKRNGRNGNISSG